MATSLVNNKYRITRRIGGGSFGEIYMGYGPNNEKVLKHGSLTHSLVHSLIHAVNRLLYSRAGRDYLFIRLLTHSLVAKLIYSWLYFFLHFLADALKIDVIHSLLHSLCRSR